jgi:uncharacterized protein YjiS (DUF1127 family)
MTGLTTIEGSRPAGVWRLAGLAVGVPVRLWRCNRQRFRAFLAFSRIDNHTLDDIGLRRTIFAAVPNNDNGLVLVRRAGCRSD